MKAFILTLPLFLFLEIPAHFHAYSVVKGKIEQQFTPGERQDCSVEVKISKRYVTLNDERYTIKDTGWLSDSLKQYDCYRIMRFDTIRCVISIGQLPEPSNTWIIVAFWRDSTVSYRAIPIR